MEGTLFSLKDIAPTVQPRILRTPTAFFEIVHSSLEKEVLSYQSQSHIQLIKAFKNRTKSGLPHKSFSSLLLRLHYPYPHLIYLRKSCFYILFLFFILENFKFYLITQSRNHVSHTKAPIFR